MKINESKLSFFGNRKKNDDFSGIIHMSGRNKVHNIEFEDSPLKNDKVECKHFLFSPYRHFFIILVLINIEKTKFLRKRPLSFRHKIENLFNKVTNNFFQRAIQRR